MVFASRSKRILNCAFSANSAGRILIATLRSSRVSLPRHTSPIPPAPRRATTSYGPRRLPVSTGMGSRTARQRQHRHVIARRGVADMTIHLHFDGCEHGRGVLAMQRLQDLRHRTQPELYFLGILRFGDTVGEQHERIAGFQLDELIPILRLREEANDEI